MVQIVNQGPSKLSSFLQHAEPGIDAFAQIMQKRRQPNIEEQKTKFGIERDRAKILEQEAAKEREFARFAQLLGIEFPQGKDQQNEISPLLEEEPPQEGISQEREMEDEIQSRQPSRRESQGLDPSQLSDQQLAFATAINPNVGRSLQHAKDVSLREKTSERKEVRESFKENQKFIDKTYDQYEDSLRRESIVERMDQLAETGELSDSGIINLLKNLGFQEEWLKNPANEEYTKLGLDLLGGGTLQSDYGSRVLQSEFQVAQQRIPTLSQTPEGRKQIAENIKTMLLPSKLKKDRMQFYLDQAERTGKPLPHDLRGKVLRDIKPQLEEAYDKFKQRNGRYKVKEGTYPDDSALEKYYFLSNGNEEKAMKMLKEDGYDIDE